MGPGLQAHVSMFCSQHMYEAAALTKTCMYPVVDRGDRSSLDCYVLTLCQHCLAVSDTHCVLGPIHKVFGKLSCVKISVKFSMHICLAMRGGTGACRLFGYKSGAVHLI